LYQNRPPSMACTVRLVSSIIGHGRDFHSGVHSPERKVGLLIGVSPTPIHARRMLKDSARGRLFSVPLTDDLRGLLFSGVSSSR
jgi:hypothetical protein